MTARFTHDFADREASLEVQVGNAAPLTLVSGATYKPFGPVAGLTLGNGLVETRGFDGRYFPERIEVPGRLLQAYTTDSVGNILGLARTVGTQSFSMTFAYQDPQRPDPVGRIPAAFALQVILPPDNQYGYALQRPLVRSQDIEEPQYSTNSCISVACSPNRRRRR